MNQTSSVCRLNSPTCFNKWDCTRPKPRAWNSSRASHTDGRDPRLSVIAYCFPECPVAGSWTWKQNRDPDSSIPVWDTGISNGTLTSTPNFFFLNAFEKIYLFERERWIFCWFTLQWPQKLPGLCQGRARSPAFVPDFSYGCRAPSVWTILQ